MKAATRAVGKLLTRHPVVVVVYALALALVVAVAVVAVGSLGPDSQSGKRGSVSGLSPERSSTAVFSACDRPTVEVASAGDLRTALGSAKPGDVIMLAEGTYRGSFKATASGAADAPITLCGSQATVLEGGDVEHGYVLHLDRASYWHLYGFAVRNGQKGIMADSVSGVLIEAVTVTGIGDEAIHLRAGSSDNRVVGNTISDTGLRKPKYGEGIYIGSAESNWCDISECEPDRSDNNLIEGNTISGTTAESIDIKEGTTGGVIRDNTFDGAAMVEADSWVDVKGNDWLIESNAGTDSPMDGFQTHQIIDGWGVGNVFRGNKAAVNGPGFGFSLTPVRDNVVECNNTASGAGEGLSNVNCSTN